MDQGAKESSAARAHESDLAKLFQDAGVPLTEERRAAALDFFANEGVCGFEDLIKFSDTIDEFVQALKLTRHLDRKLRQKLNEIHTASRPWYEKLWSAIKWTSNEVKGLSLPGFGSE